MLIINIDDFMVVKASELMPTGAENVTAGDSGYWSIGKLERSRLFTTDTGFVRTCYSDNKTIVEQYDDELNILSKIRIDKQLDLWGGACYYKGMIYVVESNEVEVEGPDSLIIRISKYNMSGDKVGYTDIKRRGTYAFGRSLDISGYNNKLYIASDHSAYEHTGLIFIEVDINNMTGRVLKEDLCHSFKQYIYGDDTVYLQELSEGSRGVKLSRVGYNEYTGMNRLYDGAIIYNFGGVRETPLAISCRADINGLACSTDNVITVGESIDQSKYDEIDDLPWNLYITVTPKNDIKNDTTTVKWLTNYTDVGNDVYASSITKISDNRFLVAWENHQYKKEPVATDINDALSWGDFHYLFIDGNGNKLSGEYTATIPISDCQPIYKNSKVVFYSSIGNMVTFYSIDADTGAMTKKAYRVAGDYATWEVKGNTLVVSGSGTVCFTSKSQWIRGNGIIGYEMPIFKPINDNTVIKKIIIKKGITSISDNCFSDMKDVKDLYIENGVETIGDDNFTDFEWLGYIYLPKSIKKLGKNFGWDGYFREEYSPEFYTTATINAVKGSYAIKYAKKNKLNYTIIPTAVKTKKLVCNSQKTTVKWKPAKKVNGYQIEYSTDPDFILNVKKVRVKGRTKNKKTISKLVRGKTYYIRVRAYKNIYMDHYVYNKKKNTWKVKKIVDDIVYGEWSKVVIKK